MELLEPINILSSKIMEIDQCCICLCEMDESNEIYKLECGHTFHTNCIIDAFRRMDNGERGSCPLCRQRPKCQIHQRRLYSKFKVIIDYVKKNKKDVNPTILEMVNKYIKMELKSKEYNVKFKDSKKALQVFEKEHNKLFSTISKLKTNVVNLKRGVRICWGIAKTICKEKLIEVMSEIKQLENDNKEVLNNRKKLTTARISNRRKLYKYDSKLYLQKNEIEDLPIVPIYVKKKVKK